jgi:hypothetical protein
MKIKRIVNGTEMEFELTVGEHMAAYYEWQNYVDEEDIANVLEDLGQSATPKQMKAIIEEYRDICSDDDTWRYNAEAAINRVLND